MKTFFTIAYLLLVFSIHSQSVTWSCIFQSTESTRPKNLDSQKLALIIKSETGFELDIITFSKDSLSDWQIAPIHKCEKISGGWKLKFKNNPQNIKEIIMTRNKLVIKHKKGFCTVSRCYLAI